MTVIAWDGKTLAADRRVSYGDLVATRTKIRRLESGAVIACSGDTDKVLALEKWYEAGANPDEWPQAQRSDNWARLVVQDVDGKVYEYNQEPYAIRCEDEYFAWGSGASFALGAMAMGADAVEAVTAAIKHCSSCGGGVDSFTVMS